MISTFPRKLMIGLLLIAVVSLLPLRSGRACGPFFTDAIFVYTKHPDFPLDKFASGKLGIIAPGWARSYLVAAYRTLSGNPLSSNEANAMNSLWDERLNNGDGIQDEEWTKKWKDARAEIPGIPAAPEINVYRNREKPNEYESFLNCQEDSFTTAVSTLKDRIARFGASSTQVHDWVLAQDIVFSNCTAGRQIPEAVRNDEQPLVQADRAYQIAAANFYAGSFDEAKQLFDVISKNNSSPWHIQAPYLAARALLRKGSFADKDADRTPPLSDAEVRLNAILKDRSLSTMHDAAARLLNLVRLRLHPEATVHELAHSIMKKDGSPNFKQNVWDYTVLLDKFVGDDSNDSDDKKVAPPAGLRSNELTDWILTFEDEPNKAASHSIDEWQKTRSLAWLVAALSTANGHETNVSELMTAASAVDHASPAFPSLAYHSVRLLIANGRASEARRSLDKLLAEDRDRLPASALNSLMAQRMTLATNLNEFLAAAQRKPAGYSDDSDGRELPEEADQIKDVTKGADLFFDEDAANAFNQLMPTGIIKDSARSNILAPNLRRDVAQEAFMRAALIDDAESASQAAPVLEQYYPELKEFLDAYLHATTPEARRFAAGFMALKFPGLRPYVSTGVGRTTELKEIDSYRDNYWCAQPPNAPGGPPEDEQKPKAKVTTVEFLKPSATLATRQLKQLEAMGPAPNFLCQMAIEWTEKNPSDPRSPEALHLAVRSTRYGCTDKETGRWSKTAFDLLHRRYPNTVWARNTKYWFNG